MDRYAEDVDARVRGGLSRSSRHGSQLRGAWRQQGVEHALDHVRGQTVRDLHRLPSGDSQQMGQGLAPRAGAEAAPARGAGFGDRGPNRFVS
jgi:hypothetical protein